MADEADIANQVVETNLKHHLAKISQVTAANADNTECEECGEEINPARRKAAPWATTCIECQSILEQRRRHVAR